MLLHEKLESLLEWLQALLRNGQPADISNILPLPEVKDCITSLTSSNQEMQNLLKSKKSVIVEFLQLDKKMIWKDKYKLCESSFHTIKSFLTSVLELTLNGKVSCNFWNCVTEDLSQKLLLPIETGCVASRTTLLNGNFCKTESRSWFSTKIWTHQMQNLPMTSCPLSMFSIAGCKENESTKPKKVRNRKKKKQPCNSIRKYRLYMNLETKQRLKQWFGSVRKTYNWTLASIKEKKYPINRFWLRNRFVNACNIPKEFRYLLDTPKHVREGAIDELVDAYKINFQKGEQFEMKFRSKKKSQSIVIPHDSIKSYKDNILTMYPTMLPSGLRMYSKQEIKFDYDCKMILDQEGRFYLCVPIRKPSASACESQAGIVALDPGVRTFLTAYGVKENQTIIQKIGDKDITRIYRLCTHLDKLKHKKAAQRMRRRIRNLVKDVHWKAAHWLCTNFKDIIIPPFQVSNMVSKKNRKITKKTVRCMLTWSHFAFRQRLQYKAAEHGCVVHVLGEEYTTKVCTNCGFFNPRVKGEKVLSCPCCELKVDRDVSGARNIFLKNVSCR